MQPSYEDDTMTDSAQQKWPLPAAQRQRISALVLELLQTVPDSNSRSASTVPGPLMKTVLMAVAEAIQASDSPKEPAFVFNDLMQRARADAGL